MIRLRGLSPAPAEASLSERFTKSLRQFGAMDADRRAALLAEAAALRRGLDDLDQLAQAEARMGGAAQARGALPAQVDWDWRPAFWMGAVQPPAHVAPTNGTPLGHGVTLFHDCPLGEIAVVQRAQPRRPTGARYGLALDVYGFAGSFLSLAIDLPEAGLAGLGRAHYLDVDFDVVADRPLGIYVRLNLRCGPNMVTLLRQVPGEGAARAAAFDLAYTDLDPARLEAGWIDVMFENPAQLGVQIADLRISRCRRADV